MTVLAIMAAALCGWLLMPSPALRRLAPRRRISRVDWAVAARWLRKPRDHREAAREAPVALEFLAVCLDAGSAVTTAVHTVAQVSPTVTSSLLGRVLAHLDVGRSPEDSWGELRDHPVWGPSARDLSRSARSGTTLSDALRRHAEDLRRDRHEEETKRARTVGVKSVGPLMACFLPAFVLVGVVPIIASLLGGFFG